MEYFFEIILGPSYARYDTLLLLFVLFANGDIRCKWSWWNYFPVILETVIIKWVNHSMLIQLHYSLCSEFIRFDFILEYYFFTNYSSSIHPQYNQVILFSSCNKKYLPNIHESTQTIAHSFQPCNKNATSEYIEANAKDSSDNYQKIRDHTRCITLIGLCRFYVEDVLELLLQWDHFIWALWDLPILK